MCYVCKSCVVSAQCTASVVCRVGGYDKSSYYYFILLLFALLPAQRAVCVSPVSCLFNVLPTQFAVQELRQVLLLLFNFAVFYYFTHSHYLGVDEYGVLNHNC